MRQSRVGLLTAALLLAWAVGCSDEDPGQPTGEVTVSKETRLPEQDPSFKSVTVNKDSVVFTFSKSPSEAGIKVGDIVVGKGGTTGYLRKVTAVSVSGNTLTASTGAASLEQVIEDGTWAVKLGQSQATTGSSISSIASVTRALGTREQALLNTQTWDLTGKTLVDKKVKGVDVKVSLTQGKATFQPDVTLAAKHSWGRLKEAKVLASGSFSLELEVTTTLSGGVKMDKSETEIALAAPVTYDLVFAIGPVPVTVQLVFTLYGGYELDASVQGTASAGFKCTSEIRAGAEYKDKQWSNLWSPQMNCTQIPPKLGLSAKAGIRVHVRPEIKALLYHSAGPRVDVEPYLLLSGTVQALPPAYAWSLQAGLMGHLGFELKLLSLTLADYSTTLMDWNTTVASGSSQKPDSGVPDASPPDAGVPDGPAVDQTQADGPLPDTVKLDKTLVDAPIPDAAQVVVAAAVVSAPTACKVLNKTTSAALQFTVSSLVGIDKFTFDVKEVSGCNQAPTGGSINGYPTTGSAVSPKTYTLNLLSPGKWYKYSVESTAKSGWKSSNTVGWFQTASVAADGSVPDQAPADAGPPDAALGDAQPDTGASQDWGTVVPGTWTTIPGGTFQMGSPSSESCRSSNETQHQVTLTHKFEIQSTEVTQGQFTSLMGYSPSYFSNCGGSCPVETVNWHEAAAYANALSAQKGKAACYACTGSGKSVTCSEATAYAGAKVYTCPGYRLPTEAEWEFAYRAGTSKAYYNGVNDSNVCSTCSTKDVKLDAVGWYCANSDVSYSGCYSYSGRCIGTHPVGGKTPNAWGLYDMAGNVWEWCHDWYGSYPSSSVTDPVGTSGSRRVFRGGSWYDLAYYCRAAARYSDWPGYRYRSLGFRLARSVP